MKIIDGSYGEGGGQILRSALALSMCTGIPVRIENIRAGRRKPGLLRQHLTCVRASQTISNAKVVGDELGSSLVVFHPNRIRAGNYDFAIGSAGSTSLVFQTVLPALLTTSGKSTVTFSGGTHNGMAPSFDFIKLCFIPALETINIQVKAELSSYGFFPNGGGKWTATIMPFNNVGIFDMTNPSNFEQRQAVVTQSGLNKSIALRELARVKKKLQWNDEDLQINQVESIGPGNVVSLRVVGNDITEIIDVVGERNLSPREWPAEL